MLPCCRASVPSYSGPRTVPSVAAALAEALNRIIDQRPALRERAQRALRDARLRLEYLIATIETGGGDVFRGLEAVRAGEVRRSTAFFASWRSWGSFSATRELMDDV